MGDAPVVSFGSESFSDLIDQAAGFLDSLEGSVVKGVVVSVDGDYALVDVALKSEGRVPIKDLVSDLSVDTVNVGDVFDVYVEKIEGRNGEAVLSREKARREADWLELQRKFENNERIQGIVSGRVRGGVTVRIKELTAFLPGSQIDVRSVRDVSALMNQEFTFAILKMDHERGNIVVSRRVILEEERSGQKQKLIDSLYEGKIVKGVVKNVTNYGVFVDLGGIDGLLHVTDMAYTRVMHPTEVLNLGDEVTVQVLSFNPKTQRISLGMKQLGSDPWQDMKFEAGQKVVGRVTNVADYGVFLELCPGVEGLVHVSEISWSRRILPPDRLYAVGDTVEVMVLRVDAERRRISLGIKQCHDHPWEAFRAEYPIGSVLEGSVRNITDYGLFVSLVGDLDGMVHLSDISWDSQGGSLLGAYSVGQSVKVKVLDIDEEHSRISLGIKQLVKNPYSDLLGDLKVGDSVTGTITSVTAEGLVLEIREGLSGFVAVHELGVRKSDQDVNAYSQGERLDSKVLGVDTTRGMINLSVKAHDVAREKEVLDVYGSLDSGSSLGSILGGTLRDRVFASSTRSPEDPTPASDPSA